MTQILRLLHVILMSVFRPRLGPYDPSLLSFRVMPADIDINFHMNNARYLSMMDHGRWDVILRSGFWREAIRKRLRPVIGGTIVRYRRSLKPFQSFILTTRLVTWDERWLYLEQTVESRGRLSCIAQLRVAFVGADGTVPPGSVAGLMGVRGGPPPPPGWIQRWRDLDGELDAHPSLTLLEPMSCAH